MVVATVKTPFAVKVDCVAAADSVPSPSAGPSNSEGLLPLPAYSQIAVHPDTDGPPTPPPARI